MNLISPESIDSMVYISVKTVYAPLILSIWRGDAAKVDRSRETADKDALSGFKVIQGYRIWHQSKEYMRLPISD